MISQAFEARRSQGRAALVPYVTAGYPAIDSTVPLLEVLASAGADVLELGIPFSDPLADGPTIQRSSFASLEGGTTVRSVLADLRVFRSRNATPVVLMTYLNPVRYFMTIVRGIFLKGTGLDVLWPQMLALAILGTMVITFSTLHFSKRLE